MKILKKILCTLLVVVVCLTSAPLEGVVGIEWPDFSKLFGNKANAFNVLWSDGHIGDLYYTFDSTFGSLVISGEGEIPAESFDTFAAIRSVYIQPGVTGIGYKAFADCINITSVYIPDSVTSISDSAFFMCENIRQITLSKNMTFIGNFAFQGCKSIESLTIPNSLTEINYGFFILGSGD